MLTIELRIHLHISRQSTFQSSYSRVECFGQVERTGIGLFCHRKQHGWFPRHRGNAHLRALCSHLHISHISQHHRHPRSSCFHQCLSHFFCTACTQHTAHNIFVSTFIVYTARSILVHLSSRIQHIAQRHPIMTHTFGVNAHLIFHQVAPHHRHLSHASCREQTRSYGPICQSA